MYIKYVSAFVVSIFLVFSASASDFVVPEQKLVGIEKTINLGELVDISISPITTNPAGLTGVSYTWLVLEPDGNEVQIKKYDTGVLFGTGLKNRRLTVICSVTYLYTTKEGDKITGAGTKTVLLRGFASIGGSVPPEPDPVIPDGKFSISKAAYQSLRKSNVSKEDKVKAATALASSYDKIVSQIGAGVLTDPKDILETSATENTKALRLAGLSIKDFPDFDMAIQERMYELYEKKILKTAEDYKNCFLEINIGLNYIK